uniref:Nucleoside diphosphate kinase-like domain-containing protein n=1 Tax=Dromaius novaehollandiae TaxID=8790 RepID=A0A8C4KGA7_DRONO
MTVSLRAEYAVDSIPLDQLHGSSSPDDAQKELQFFFPQEHTLALIKPAAVKEHKGKFASQNLVMILTKENAVEEWRQLMGPADPEIAKMTSPESIRAQFAQDILSNAVHGSSNKEHALKSIDMIRSMKARKNSLHTFLTVPIVFNVTSYFKELPEKIFLLWMGHLLLQAFLQQKLD